MVLRVHVAGLGVNGAFRQSSRLEKARSPFESTSHSSDDCDSTTESSDSDSDTSDSSDSDSNQCDFIAGNNSGILQNRSDYSETSTIQTDDNHKYPSKDNTQYDQWTSLQQTSKDSSDFSDETDELADIPISVSGANFKKYNPGLSIQIEAIPLELVTDRYTPQQMPVAIVCRPKEVNPITRDVPIKEIIIINQVNTEKTSHSIYNVETIDSNEASKSNIPAPCLPAIDILVLERTFGPRKPNICDSLIPRNDLVQLDDEVSYQVTRLSKFLWSKTFGRYF